MEIELKGKSVIICQDCNKIIGVNYNWNFDSDVQSDCFCIECHNKACEELDN